MKVFISYASSDEPLARKVGDALRASGLEVWDGSLVMPGENWAARVGEALQEAEAMVVLLTPEALRSKQVSYEIAYALGKQEYSGRLIPVLASPDQLNQEEIPWILKKLPMIRLPEYEREEEGLNAIARALSNGGTLAPR
jgi:hypothetical protein